MSRPAGQTLLRQSLAALARVGVVPDIGPVLNTQTEIVEQRLREAVLDEIPAFSESGNPDVLPQLAEHTAMHIGEIRRLLGGGHTGEFDFVRTHARRRAEQKFPLEATLHAYRCGHKIFSRWIRDAALLNEKQDARQIIAAVADFAIEYTNTISTIATSEYVSRTRRLAEAEGDLRTELMNVLLGGYDESDGRVARILRRAGYLEQRKSYCVAVSQPTEPAEMDNPGRAQRLADAISQSVSRLPIRSLTGIRENLVVAVFSATRRLSGWTAPQATLAESVRSALWKIGPYATIGLSGDVPSTSHVPRAFNEARLALDFADIRNRVLRISDISIRQMVLRTAQDNMQSTLPGWVADFLAADKKAKGSLIDTLRAYADADMNTIRAAEKLSVHPNTVYSRLQRVKDATGLDALKFHVLSELLLAADYERI